MIPKTEVETPASWRKILAEFCGTGLLVTVVVGSGIAASRLSPGEAGLQLLVNALVTAAGLYVLILMLGPVSGAHLNPIVSIVDFLVPGFRTGSRVNAVRAGSWLAELPLLTGYLVAQFAGAIAGSILADAMFAAELVRWSDTERSAGHLLLGEVVATAGLVLLVFSLSRTGRTAQAPAAVAAYIGAAYWFTSSTSFANPAVTLGRAFTGTFAGIAPASVGGFVLAQLAGGLVGAGLLAALFPRSDRGVRHV
jgi:glycerol uptake facilitator-like aquaporin